MARADGIVTKNLQGTIGKELVFRQWDGVTIVAKAPKQSKKDDPTPEQKVRRRSFTIASRYAKAIVKAQDQTMAKAYATVLRRMQNVYGRAMEDYLTSPTVEKIDRSNYRGAVNDKIIVTAVDDFRV